VAMRFWVLAAAAMPRRQCSINAGRVTLRGRLAPRLGGEPAPLVPCPCAVPELAPGVSLEAATAALAPSRAMLLDPVIVNHKPEPKHAVRATAFFSRHALVKRYNQANGLCSRTLWQAQIHVPWRGVASWRAAQSNSWSER
jgi:hypothetical protein